MGENLVTFPCHYTESHPCQRKKKKNDGKRQGALLPFTFSHLVSKFLHLLALSRWILDLIQLLETIPAQHKDNGVNNSLEQSFSYTTHQTKTHTNPLIMISTQILTERYYFTRKYYHMRFSDTQTYHSALWEWEKGEKHTRGLGNGHGFHHGSAPIEDSSGYSKPCRRRYWDSDEKQTPSAGEA